jgi:hypothetical protein
MQREHQSASDHKRVVYIFEAYANDAGSFGGACGTMARYLRAVGFPLTFVKATKTAIAELMRAAEPILLCQIVRSHSRSSRVK